MGTAYGAPRLRAADVDRLGGSSAAAPLRLYAAPTAAHVWRLVVVTGRIADVHKLGDRSREELVVGSARLPIVGQAGAGIPVDRVIEGRQRHRRRDRPGGLIRRPRTSVPRSCPGPWRISRSVRPRRADPDRPPVVQAHGGDGGAIAAVTVTPTTSPDPSVPDADLSGLAGP